MPGLDSVDSQPDREVSTPVYGLLSDKPFL